ncbi:PQQ-binding-like beta-propeller repeat protein, partial [Marinovum algicola]|uniref:outer membrane protein assembly factor BamB family protein n=1 Tax=Marinovum algicola TaxID=42444 RepID=UPI0024BB87AF
AMTMTRCAAVVALLATVQPAAAQAPSSPETAPIFSPVTWERLLNAADEPENWLMYSGTLDSQRFSRLDQIHNRNVGELELKWAYQIPQLDRAETTPLVVDGVMFITEAPSNVVAVDAATGRQYWRYNHELPDDLRICCGRNNRGVAVQGDRVIMSTLDAHLVALDAKTGELLGAHMVGAEVTELIQGFVVGKTASCAAMALTATHLSAAAASLTWALWERIKFGKASLVGIVTGTIAGLASITPASGFVGPWAALLIGAVAGILCQEAVVLIRNKAKIDDTLDVFAVHGVGGIFGTIMIAVFGAGSFAAQLGSLAIVGAFTVVVTVVLIFVVKAITPLRVDEETEHSGLDIMVHGERAYDHAS